MESAADVIVIGAGAAGLAAAMRLSAAGKRVLLLEAQDRIGGRICTVERNGYRIEAGAEFIHGRAPEIFELVERFGLQTSEVEGETYCNLGDGLKECDFFEEVDQVFEKLKRYTGPDKSFEEFVGESCEQESTRQWARGYVAGFHGALPELAGVAGLIDDTLAEERIDGERSWRIHAGYGALVDAMWQCCERQGVLLRISSPVTAVRWSEGIEVECEAQSYRARRAIITLPLSILQAASVTFDPPLTSKDECLRKLAMGTVARCTLAFRRPFWRELHGVDGHELGDVSFMFSRREDFPTWWTQAPSDVPVLTAWASAVTALGLTGQPNDVVIDRALRSLQAITGIAAESLRREFVSAVWHDWRSDPWIRGAYSYAKVGGSGAYRELAEPLGCLHFAGEATDFTGNHATVHGAIASGYRAADEVLGAGQ